MTEPLIDRLREVLTVRLVADQLDSAANVRRMMIERAEAADMIERLVEALRPFACFVDQFDHLPSGSGGLALRGVTIDDLRAARVALTEQERKS